MGRVGVLLVVGLLGCGPTVSTGGNAQGSTSAAGSSGGTSTDGTSDTEAGGSTTTGDQPPHCQVEVLSSTQLSVERFGSLTVPHGHLQLLLLGGTGWTLSGTFGAPITARFFEPIREMVAGRFGPEGAWAYAHADDDVVSVIPVDDPDTTSETIIVSDGRLIVGDLDEDGLDDLIATDGGTVRAWKADGAGGFAVLAESEVRYPNAIRGFAPANDGVPPAVLITNGTSFAGTLGLELAGGALREAFRIDAINLWSIQGVRPADGATRSLLTAVYGGTLIDPVIGGVEFLDQRDGEWTSRGHDFRSEVFAEPRAMDLDGDGVLDAVAGLRDSRLVGGCGADDPLSPCLELPLAGMPESVAVDEGLVYVATADSGLWVYGLGECL